VTYVDSSPAAPTAPDKRDDMLIAFALIGFVVVFALVMAVGFMHGMNPPAIFVVFLGVALLSLGCECRRLEQAEAAGTGPDRETIP
jgi:hypothetical protein